MSELAPSPHPGLRWLARAAHVEDLARQAARATTQFRVALAAFAVEEHFDALSPEATNGLALALSLSPQQMSNRLGDALGFHTHPRLAGLVMDGTWLIEHADAVQDGLRCADLTPAQQGAVLDLVLARCRSRVPWELRKAVQAAVAVLFPDLLIAKAEKAKTDRDVRLQQDRLGEAALVAWGPPQLVEAMMTAIDTMSFPPAPGDTRTAAQRRFDTLYALLTGQAQPSQWQVHVLTTLEALLGESEQPAETARGQLLPAQVAREIAESATLRRAVVDEHGQLIAAEASTDRPTAADTTPLPAAQPFVDPDQLDLLALAEPDPDTPNAEDLAWFAQHQSEARYRDPLPVPPVTDLDAEPVDDTDAHPVAAEASLDQPQTDTHAEPETEPEIQADSETEADRAAAQDPKPALFPALASASEDSLTCRLQRLLAKPFVPADLTSPGYRPNRPLRRHLLLRDRTCRFPGCPNRICDLDHVTAYPAGPTSEPNLARECEPHHFARHHYFHVSLLEDGTLRWTDRGGRHFDSPVRPLLITTELYRHLHGPRRGTDPPGDRSSDP